MTTKNARSPKTIFSNTWWCLKFVYRSSPWLFNAIIFFQILASVTPFIRNKYFAKLIDLIVYRPQNNWINYFTIFALLLTLSSIFLFIQSQLSRILDTKLQAFLRTSFINKVSHLDYQHLEGKDTGNLISKVDEEFGWRTRETVSDVSTIFANMVSLSTVTVILLPKFPILWLLLLLSQIPQYLVKSHWIQKDWQLHEDNSEKNKLMWDFNYQLRNKNHIAELRINNAVDYIFQKYNDIFKFFTNGRVNLRTQQIPVEIGLIIFSTIIDGICLLTLIINTKNGLISIGLFTFYFQSITQTADFFRGLVYSSTGITENSYHIGNFRSIMNLKNVIPDGTKDMQLPSPPKIEFNDVSFKYPGSNRYIYRHLNLTINAGEEIAIVGANGAGKSTLIKLLCHFYEPTSGKILINDINLKDIKMDQWYPQLSYLAQEFNHYGNLNLRENVVLGNPKQIDDQKVLQALEKADAEFTKKYTNKLDTPLSQRYGGEEPSWGQMQKIAIARVFYRNSPIVILDEPTASIDAVSESKIFNGLYKQIHGKTLIIVSHRFSTVRNAQRIIVIDKGKIVEQGTHSSLIKQANLYAHSFHLQAKGYK